MKSGRSIKSKLFMALAGAAAVALPLATASGAGASSPSPNAWTPVPGGVNASALPHATVFGSTPSDTPETVSFIMKVNSAAQLASVATHAQHSFDSVSQFAHTYGASPSVISALTSYLHGFGITTSVYADNIDIVAKGTAGQFDTALSTSQSQYKVPRIAGHNGARSIPAQTVHANTRSPELPFRLSGAVLAVLGLTNYSPFTTHTAHIDTAITQPKSGNTDACLALTGLTSACNLPSDYTKNYGLNSLYSHGASGQGQTAAIVTLAAVDPGGPQYFWQNIANIPASSRTLTVQNIDGGPGDPSDAAGTGETDLDVEQSGSIAPRANIIVYQAPNTDSGFADAFFTAASQNTASSVSASWGESETIVTAAVQAGEETPAYEAAFDEAFEEFAAQGQSGFLSSGDQAAYDASADLGTTNLAVDVSADSPYITAAGGTTLPLSDTFTSPNGTATISVNKERAWGWDYLWQAVATLDGISLSDAAESQVAGSGGGFSVVEGTPSYQQGVSGTHFYSAVQYLTPTDYQNIVGSLIEPTDWSFNPTPSVSHGVAVGRAVPDVSADADPYSGYLLYEPSWATVDQPTLQGGWGGTSFVAPQLNGSAAVIDSYLGHRVGFWNPAMYAAATGSNSPLAPLSTSGTSNDNLFFTGTPGTVYNEATGLGIPNLSALAGHLASGH
ncbi:MAG TPA: S53 family peptidase [Galbitalea sp.]|jgi:subtilase family serine protease|nr:S53 family peptidase [Galbitalea sp.]